MRSRLPCVLVVIGCLSVQVGKAANLSGDWPQWRGPNRDGISEETGLLESWQNKPPKLLWTASGLGSGFASISIADGLIFTMGDKGNDQLVIAVSLEGGSPVWERRIGQAGGIGYPGSRCTPTVDGDRLYAIGTKGDLACLDTQTGKILWTRNFPKDFNGRMMSGWGFSESPLIDGDKVVCTPGGPDAGIVALDKKTGEEIWRATIPAGGDQGRDGAGYSSIVISEAASVRQYVQLMGRGCVGVEAETGKFLWQYNRVANGTANIPTPIVSGNYVFCSSGYGTGAALLQIQKRGRNITAKEVYFLKANQMQNHHGGMILVNGYVYCGSGHNNGFPICVQLRTGKIAWFAGRGPGSGSAAVAYADGHLYFRYQDGVMALIEADPKKYKLKGTFKIPNVSDPSWPHPVIADGKLYLREQDRLLCYDVRR